MQDIGDEFGARVAVFNLECLIQNNAEKAQEILLKFHGIRSVSVQQSDSFLVGFIFHRQGIDDTFGFGVIFKHALVEHFPDKSRNQREVPYTSGKTVKFFYLGINADGCMIVFGFGV